MYAIIENGNFSDYKENIIKVTCLDTAIAEDLIYPKSYEEWVNDAVEKWTKRDYYNFLTENQIHLDTDKLKQRSRSGLFNIGIWDDFKEFKKSRLKICKYRNEKDAYKTIKSIDTMEDLTRFCFNDKSFKIFDDLTDCIDYIFDNA